MIPVKAQKPIEYVAFNRLIIQSFSQWFNQALSQSFSQKFWISHSVGYEANGAACWRFDRKTLGGKLNTQIRNANDQKEERKEERANRRQNFDFRCFLFLVFFFESGNHSHRE